MQPIYVRSMFAIFAACGSVEPEQPTDGGVDGSDVPSYLAHCGSLFAARVTEKQIEADATFPPDCDAPLRATVGQVSADVALCNAGESANACRDRVYATPPSIASLETGCAPGTNCLRGGWLPRCEDGTDTCAEPEAVCQDGTRPMIYAERATVGGASDDWVFFLGGEGGPCQSASCWFNYRFAHLVGDGVFERAMSGLHPDYVTRSSEMGGGIESGNPASPMARYNRVRFNRCADVASDAEQDVPISDGVPQEIIDRYSPGSLPLPLQTRTSTAKVFHRGFAIWSTAFKTLESSHDVDGDGSLDLPGLANARRIILAGSSDAGNWMVYAADRLAEKLRVIAPDATVEVIIDGFFEPGLDGEGRFAGSAPVGFDSFTQPYSVTHACALPDNGDGIANETCSDAGFSPGVGAVVANQHDALAGRGTVLDASCEAMHGVGAAPCYDKIHTLMHHVSTRFLVVSDQEDHVIAGAGIAYADDPAYRWPTPDVYRARVLAQARDANALWTTAAREDGAGIAGNAMFVLRKSRRGSQPWERAEHTHLGSDSGLRSSMTLCTAVGAPGTTIALGAMIDSWAHGTASSSFVVEDATAGGSPFWVTGDQCIAPE